MELVARLENLVSASCLMIDPKEQPMLLAEPPLNTQQHREKSDLSAYRYLLLSYVLTSFATTGHATSLVVDWALMHEGYVLQNVYEQLAGGTSSMQQLKERLEKDLIKESPHSARVDSVGEQ
ncbi:hypothetical protein YC2023_111823 [Brassica napus]